MLSPGLFVRVRLPIGEPYRAIMIDERALGTDQGQKFVYVVDKDNNAQYRRVEVGKLQNGSRVVLKGIAEGERVVVSGLQRVRPARSRSHGQTGSARPARVMLERRKWPRSPATGSQPTKARRETDESLATAG